MHTASYLWLTNLTLSEEETQSHWILGTSSCIVNDLWKKMRAWGKERSLLVKISCFSWHGSDVSPRFFSFMLAVMLVGSREEVHLGSRIRERRSVVALLGSEPNYCRVPINALINSTIFDGLIEQLVPLFSLFSKTIQHVPFSQRARQC